MKSTSPYFQKRNNVLCPNSNPYPSNVQRGSNLPFSTSFEIYRKQKYFKFIGRKNIYLLIGEKLRYPDMYIIMRKVTI